MQLPLPLESITAAIIKALPSNLQDAGNALGNFIYEMFNKTTTESGSINTTKDKSIVLALNALAGRYVNIDDAVVKFGEGNNFGDISLGDIAGNNIIKVSINLVLPAISQIMRPVPSFYRSAVQRMVEDYDTVFGGRDNEMLLLDEWLADDSYPFCFIHAPTGRGKSALLIHWIATIEKRMDVRLIFIPISIRYETATIGKTLIALATALADVYGESDTVYAYNTSPDQLRPLIADYFRRDLLSAKKLLIIFDGLDEAVGWQVKRDLFPKQPKPYIKFLTTAREKANTTVDDWLYQIGWDRAKTSIFTLPNLGRAAVSDILSRMGRPLDTLAGNVDLLGEIARISQGDPLTIRFLVEGLQDNSITPGRLLKRPVGLESYIRDWLDELEMHSNEIDAVYALLAACALAVGPLTADDIVSLEPSIFQKRAALNQAASRVARFIIGDGSNINGYVFSHARLREVFLERVLSSNERTLVSYKFISYGEGYYKNTQIQVPNYVRQFWFSHLFDSGEELLAIKVATEFQRDKNDLFQYWARVRSSSEGNYAGYLNDLGRVVCFGAENKRLSRFYKHLLISGSIRSQIGNLTPEFLLMLVTVGTPDGKWSTASVIEQIKQMPEPVFQKRTILLLANTLTDPPFSQLLDAAQYISYERVYVQTLVGVLKLLPKSLTWEVIDMIRSIREPFSRLRLFQIAKQHLSNGKDVLASLSLEAEDEDGFLLSEEDLYFDEELEDEEYVLDFQNYEQKSPEDVQLLLNESLKIGDDGAKQRLFEAFEKYSQNFIIASSHSYNSPTTVNKQLKDWWNIFIDLKDYEGVCGKYGLKPVLDVGESKKSFSIRRWKSYLRRVDSLPYGDDKALIYLGIIRLLPEQLLPELLWIIRDLKKDVWQFALLTAVAERLEEPLRQNVLREALFMATQSENEYVKLSMLSQIAPVLWQNGHSDIWGLTLSCSEEMDDEIVYEILYSSIQWLPEKMIMKLLDIISEFSFDDEIVNAFTHISPCLHTIDLWRRAVLITGSISASDLQLELLQLLVLSLFKVTKNDTNLLRPLMADLFLASSGAGRPTLLKLLQFLLSQDEVSLVFQQEEIEDLKRTVVHVCQIWP